MLSFNSWGWVLEMKNYKFMAERSYPRFKLGNIENTGA